MGGAGGGGGSFVWTGSAFLADPSSKLMMVAGGGGAGGGGGGFTGAGAAAGDGTARGAPAVPPTPSRGPPVGTRIGDQAASSCWARGSYLLDYTYVTCPNRETGSLRYRAGFRTMCAPDNRKLPLYLDSGAYHESAKTAPTWSSYTRYSRPSISSSPMARWPEMS